MSTCRNCGIEHTPEMVEARMCFECGTEFVPPEDSHIDVVPVVMCEDEVTFVEYEDLSVFNDQIKNVRSQLIHYINKDTYTVEEYLDMLNSMRMKDYLATIQNNFNLLNKVYEQTRQYDLLEVGERLLLFVSQGEIGKRLSRGYLVTNRQIIFWDQKSFSILELCQVESLGVDCENGIWYLNELKDCQLSSPCCKVQEHAVIFALLVTLICKPKKKAEGITSPVEQIKEKAEHVEQMQNVSNQSPLTLADKLRELKTLYEDGLITETDYEETRKRMLDKI